MNVRKSSRVINRLTALWAVSESGLGGIMHAFKIPFTGFFLGAFAIVIISLIAFYSVKKWNAVLLATLIVMIIKAVASPQSPPTAYVAVAFQGLAGAAIYHFFTVNKLSAVLFGMIALAESALQKVIVLTLIFGKNIWQALDALWDGIVKDFHLGEKFSFSFLLIVIYIAVYILWGAFVGAWSVRFCNSLETRAPEVLLQFGNMKNTLLTSGNKTSGRNKRWIFFLLLLAIISSVFLLKGNISKIEYIVLRTLAALLLLFFIINPLIKYFLNKWLRQKGITKRYEISQVLEEVPRVRTYIKPALQMAKNNQRGLAVYAAFIVNWIVLALYYDHEER